MIVREQCFGHLVGSLRIFAMLVAGAVLIAGMTTAMTGPAAGSRLSEQRRRRAGPPRCHATLGAEGLPAGGSPSPSRRSVPRRGRAMTGHSRSWPRSKVPGSRPWPHRASSQIREKSMRKVVVVLVSFAVSALVAVACVSRSGTSTRPRRGRTGAARSCDERARPDGWRSGAGL